MIKFTLFIVFFLFFQFSFAQTNCTTTNGSDYYNLNPMTRTKGQSDYHVFIDAQDADYYVNICAPAVNSDEKCSSDQAVCQEIVHIGNYGCGSAVNYTISFDNDTQSVLIVYTEGSVCPVTNEPRISYVYVACDPNQNPGTIVDVAEAQPCIYTFHMASVYGCPVSSLDEFDDPEQFIFLKQQMDD